MKRIVWKPTSPQNTRMTSLMNTINFTYNKNIDSYAQLHEWSVKNIPQFWKEIWNYCDIIHSKGYNNIVDDTKKMPGAKWFKGTKLNFAENLLRYRDDRPAIKYKGEKQAVISITYKQLFNEVEKLTHSLRNLGIKKGDRIVGYMPNIPETVIAMLATSSIGAIWSSTSPDFGIKGVLDRFQQITPKIIFSTNRYFYNGKEFDILQKLKDIVAQLPSIEKVVITDNKKKTDISFIENSIYYDEFICKNPQKISFEQLSFNHPLYIMYSSGTTGLPKSIVHSSGGTLIQHMKELIFHCNLKRDDSIFYFTTCGWMMWNWLVSSLAIGSTIVLYDGSPMYPNLGCLWELSDNLGITIFGTSAKFIDSCRVNDIIPSTFSDLSKLRMILSTGSPLIEENFDYIYNNVKSNVHLGSISGGTDIISCFALSNPMLPVERGELQCIGLGMDVHAFNSNGKSVINEKAELVCTSPFPSMPISFWNDSNGEKYRNAYFLTFSGVWHHGDFIRISNNGSVKIYGRSDTTLNPGGVRIGTAEIYRIVESIEFVDDSLVVGQKWNGDQRVVLFLKMKSGFILNNTSINKIKKMIKNNCSPKHIPKKIIPIDGIPYTINGKKVELAVKKILEGDEVKNIDSLENPHVLELYKNLEELQS